MSRENFIVILGPTASGKSELAVKLAQKFKGEIISADSRQVYKGMDVGTNKITRKEMRGIPHYLLDVVSPRRRFTVVQYRKLALEAANKILKNKKIPLLVGGTGFYIQALTDGIIIPEVKPDWRLRVRLEKLKTLELFKKLKLLDPARARTIDKNNRRRLIRALEIVLKTKKPVPKPAKVPPRFNILTIGVIKTLPEIEKAIAIRLRKRLKRGMIAEVRKLRKTGLSWKRLEEFGLDYRYVAQYLQGKINYREMFERIRTEERQYAKRQMTWFFSHDEKDKRIHWVKNHKQAEKLIKRFLFNNPRMHVTGSDPVTYGAGRSRLEKSSVKQKG